MNPLPALKQLIDKMPNKRYFYYKLAVYGLTSVAMVVFLCIAVKQASHIN